MAKYKTIKSLSPTERAYMAGIVDGEGTVTLSVHQKGGSRFITVSISNTDRRLLEYIRKITGVGKLTNKRVAQVRHTPSFVYQVYSRQALDVLQQIEPFLKTYKKRRARLALKNYLAVTPRNGKYDEATRKRKEKFVKDFFTINP